METTPTPLRRAVKELLSRLLEAHERSAAYGTAGPWRRDVILRLSARAFPAAFGPDGREELESLRAAAAALEEAGAVRVVRHRASVEEIAELRIAAEHLDSAYAMATKEGFEPLARGIEAVREHLDALLEKESPAWMRTFLMLARDGLLHADPAPVGMSRERFKREWRELVDGLSVAVALSQGQSGWERVVSERIFGDSKRLASVRPRVAELLTRADPRWTQVEVEDPSAVLEAYGVRRRPGLIRCAGAALLEVRGMAVRLEHFEPTAHLPESWSNAWVDGVTRAAPETLTTIENEYPFLSYVEDAGGPEALGRRSEMAVYTAGFPTPALMDALGRLVERSPGTRLRHWGDADLGGLRIWWFMRTHLQREIAWFRTDAQWIEAASARAAQPLEALEREALRRLRAEIESHGPLTEDMATAIAIIDALLRLGIKLEQERF